MIDNGIKKVFSTAEFTAKMGDEICFSNQDAGKNLGRRYPQMQGYKVKVIDSLTQVKVVDNSPRCAKVKQLPGYSEQSWFDCESRILDHQKDPQKGLDANVKDKIRAMSLYCRGPFFFKQVWTCDDSVQLLRTASPAYDTTVRFNITYLRDDGVVIGPIETESFEMIKDFVNSSPYYQYDEAAVKISSVTPFQEFNAPFSDGNYLFKNGYLVDPKDSNTVNSDDITRRFHTRYPDVYNPGYIVGAARSMQIAAFSQSPWEDLIDSKRPDVKVQLPDADLFRNVEITDQDNTININARGYLATPFRFNIESKMPLQKFYVNSGIIGEFECVAFPYEHDAREAICTIRSIQSQGSSSLFLYAKGSCEPLTSQSFYLVEGMRVHLPLGVIFTDDKTAEFHVCTEFGECMVMMMGKRNYGGDPYHLIVEQPIMRDETSGFTAFFSYLWKGIVGLAKFCWNVLTQPIKTIWDFLKFCAVIVIGIVALILFILVFKMLFKVLCWALKGKAKPVAVGGVVGSNTDTSNPGTNINLKLVLPDNRETVVKAKDVFGEEEIKKTHEEKDSQ